MSDEQRDLLVEVGHVATKVYLTAPDGVLATSKDFNFEGLIHAEAETNRIAFGILDE